MATFATLDDVRAYGLTVNDEAESERRLLVAERDINRILAGSPDPDTGLRLVFADLDTPVAEALTRAVCAQFEYRFTMGDDFFIRPQPKKQTGPNGMSIEGKLPKIGPRVWDELEQTDLALVSTRAGSTRRGATPDEAVWFPPIRP